MSNQSQKDLLFKNQQMLDYFVFNVKINGWQNIADFCA